MTQNKRKEIFEAAIRTLVQLQSVDTDKLDLDGIGDKENFFHQRVSIQLKTKCLNCVIHNVVRVHLA